MAKHCRKCEQTKPAADFQKCARNSDGLQSHCRECRTHAAIEYRERTREHRLAYNREYHAANRDRRAAYYQSRRDHFTAGMRARYEADKATYAANSKAWYEANKERHLAANRRWREENPAYFAAYNRAYYEATREAQLERGRQIRAENRDRYNEYSRAYRAKRRGQFVEYVASLVVLERDDGVCGICGGDVDPFDFHVDHIVPLSRGGEHSYANVQVAHPTCNLRKHARMPHELGHIGVAA